MSTDHFEFGGDVVWRPTPEVIDRARLTTFMRRHGLPDYAALMQRSTTDIAWFWNAVFEDLDIHFYKPYRTVVDTSDGIAWPRWCVDGQMNIIHNCLDKWIGTAVETRTVLTWEGEEGRTRTLTYGELQQDVNRCANALRSLGLKKGDRVGLFMPMCPE
ncbi:MAG: acetyl-coenzyme A synthetase N-terminal domain-containing protein, partial [Vicinamibacterales bacterium]